MKILCLCSALDLQFRYGCTPAWWQLFKGLYEAGHDVIAVPYQGAAVESPWWRVYPNPCQYEGTAFSKVKSLFGGGPTPMEQGVRAQVTKGLIDHWIRPRWEDHLHDIMRREKDVDAIVLFSIPVNHMTGLPGRIRERYGVPIVFYDGDAPASLPRFGGFASGFRIYEGANLQEFDAVISNSAGAAGELTEMGAQRVETVFWGVDPDLYAPVELDKDQDVFFYGYGSEYREQWIANMLVAPSRALPDRRFVVGGKGFAGDMGAVNRLGDVPFSVFRNVCCRSHINLNITRDAHASVEASSSMRPFELAAMGCCMVSNPVAGMDQWFEPGKELVIINSDVEALKVYEELLEDADARHEMGEAARKRVLEEHTHRHRAEQLAQILGSF